MTKTLPPPSSSSFAINLAGGVTYLLTIIGLSYWFSDLHIFYHALIGILIAMIPMIAGEFLILKVHKRPAVGLTPPSPPNPKRAKTKIAGFLVSLGLLAALYYIIPYYHLPQYQNALVFLAVIGLPFAVLGCIYIEYTDCRLSDPDDNLWHFGNLVTLQTKKVDYRRVVKHLKSVLLRGYFLPMMFVFLMGNISEMGNYGAGFMESFSGDILQSEIFKIVMTCYSLLFAMDAMFGTIGYIAVFKVMDSDIRSTEPTFLGWLVCIICYEPFADILFLLFVFTSLFQENPWSIWLADHQTLLILWGALIIIVSSIEAVATLSFGIRFSNLTYRGLISNGPFRLTKHPQYISKLVNRFLVFIPFLRPENPMETFYALLAYSILVLIYYLRAKTEENHLSRYPEYVEYANWVNKHGVFRFLNKILPFLQYSEKKALAGKLF